MLRDPHPSFRRFAALMLPLLLAGVVFAGPVSAAPQASDEHAQAKDAEEKAAEEKADAELKAAELKEAEEEAARSRPKKHAPVERPEVFAKAKPQSLDDLKTIEARVAKVVEKALRCVVGVRVGAAQGSGVVISEDGYVLTAGHVCRKPGLSVVFLFPDGQTVRGKTLGLNRTLDSGLMKITTQGKWPHVELGVSSKLDSGNWAIAIGHPRGYQIDRPPVVRTGRVILANERVVQTDCTLFSGDSGGPLFDVDGRVIGIHSRIGGRTSQNYHVPIDTYHATWQRLAMSDVWPAQSGAMLGIDGQTVDEGCRITKIWPGLAADEAGMMEGDIVTKFNGKEVRLIEALRSMIGKLKPGDEVEIEILRDGKKMKLTVMLGAW